MYDYYHGLITCNSAVTRSDSLVSMQMQGMQQVPFPTLL
jgi:hypothetical protein